MKENNINLGECPVCRELLISEEEMSAGICAICEETEGIEEDEDDEEV